MHHLSLAAAMLLVVVVVAILFVVVVVAVVVVVVVVLVAVVAVVVVEEVVVVVVVEEEPADVPKFPIAKSTAKGIMQRGVGEFAASTIWMILTEPTFSIKNPSFCRLDSQALSQTTNLAEMANSARERHQPSWVQRKVEVHPVDAALSVTRLRISILTWVLWVWCFGASKGTEVSKILNVPKKHVENGRRFKQALFFV